MHCRYYLPWHWWNEVENGQDRFLLALRDSLNEHVLKAGLSATLHLRCDGYIILHGYPPAINNLILPKGNLRP